MVHIKKKNLKKKLFLIGETGERGHRALPELSAFSPINITLL